MLMWRGVLAAGLSRKQSLLAPDSSRPLGVTMSSGVRPFCSSSHISAIDSLYPPPQSSTDSPKEGWKKAHKWKHSASENALLVEDLPTNLTFHTRWGSSRLSGLKELILAHIWPNTDFVPSGPARPPLLRERFTCTGTGGQNDLHVLT